MIRMKNKWLSLFISKVQVVVPSMSEVTQLRQQGIVIYGIKKHPDGYLITIRKDIAQKLGGYEVVRTLSIYPAFIKIGVPLLSLTFALMILMGRYTIGYRIDGNLDDLEKAELQEFISPYFKQVGPFHLLKGDLNLLRLELEDHYNEYAWINIYRKGTDVVFDVYDIPMNEEKEEDSYSNTLYAKRSGLIQNYVVDSCRVLVEQNQVVKEGDPLVTCNVEQPYTNEIIPIDNVARGEVWANTWYEVEVTAQKSYSEEMYTTNKITQYVLHLGGAEIELPSEELTYEKYGEVIKEYNPFFFSEESPLFLEKRQYYEKSDIIKTNTYDEIKANLMVLVKNSFKQQTDGEFIIKNLEIISEEETDEQIYFKCHLTIYENIAY